MCVCLKQFEDFIYLSFEDFLKLKFGVYRLLLWVKTLWILCSLYKPQYRTYIQNVEQAIILGNCRYGFDYHIFLLMVLSYKKKSIPIRRIGSFGKIIQNFGI